MQTKRKKVVILGNSGVGKTSIINRYADQTVPFENIQPTLGFLFTEKQHPLQTGESITLDIWDTAGQERYRSIAKIYYKDASVILIVYDVTNPESFEQLKHWVDQVKNNTPKHARIIIVGNKIDLLDEHLEKEAGYEEVPYLEADTYRKSIGAQLKYTSAKNQKGIKQLFDSVAENCQKIVVQVAKEQEQKKVNLKRLEKQKKQNSNCC